MSVQDLAQLKKRLETIDGLIDAKRRHPELWTRLEDDTLHSLQQFPVSEIRALLSELEQAERERDAGEIFRGQMQAALGCDTSEGKVWFATGLLARAQTLVQREAALRTLREASAAQLKDICLLNAQAIFALSSLIALIETAAGVFPQNSILKRLTINLDENCIETIKRLTPDGGEEISFGGLMGGVKLVWNGQAEPAPTPSRAESLDAGHKYALRTLDGNGGVILTFVKREGEKYPGNVGHYSGTTTQEVLRALIDRTKYVNKQIDFPENAVVVSLLRQALWLLEVRAARTHGRYLKANPSTIEMVETCSTCGHIECIEHEAEASSLGTKEE